MYSAYVIGENHAHADITLRKLKGLGLARFRIYAERLMPSVRRFAKERGIRPVLETACATDIGMATYIAIYTMKGMHKKAAVLKKILRRRHGPVLNISTLAQRCPGLDVSRYVDALHRGNAAEALHMVEEFRDKALVKSIKKRLGIPAVVVMGLRHVPRLVQLLSDRGFKVTVV